MTIEVDIEKNGEIGNIPIESIESIESSIEEEKKEENIIEHPIPPPITIKNTIPQQPQFKRQSVMKMSLIM
jgi:hypothetical protein